MRLLFKRQLPLFTSSFTSSRPLSGSNLITTPIFYVNAKPHIGHLYSAVLADVLKRWSVFRRVPCFLSTGTDEHGLKIQEASAKAGVDPGTFCASVSESFRGLFDRGNVSYDDYIRTAEPRHYAAVQHLWKKLEKSGYIYKGVHEGWYSISDETFFPETQVEKQFKKDGSTQMISKETGKVVEWSSEQNYKFRLSAFKEFLREWLKSNPEVIYPKAQYLNVLRAVEGDNALSDISVSRPSSRLQWGIPVPQDPSQVIYVWLDALTNYLTVTGYPWESRNEEVKAVAWPPKYHIVGKDIIKFHAIYWPAFLLAAGLELPQKIICHSHWLHNNEKMSKSLGNVVDPDELLKTYGSDVTRYFFIRDGSIEHDSEFSWASIDKRYRELGIHLGNLLSRCSGKKVNSNGSVPIVDFKSLDSEASIIMERCTSLRGLVNCNFENIQLSAAVESILSVLASANKYWDDKKPWILADHANNGDITAAKMLRNTLALEFEVLRICSLLLQPIMPEKAAIILDTIGVEKDERLWENAIPGKRWRSQQASDIDEIRLISTSIILFPKLKK